MSRRMSKRLNKRSLYLVLAIALALWVGGAPALEGEEEEEQVETGGGTTTEDTTGAGGPSIPEGDVRLAREHMTEGQRLYLAGNYREALEAFQSAYRAWQHPAFLWNVGQACRRNREWVEAISAYNRYIAAYRQTRMAPERFDYVVYIHIAECQFETREVEEALQSLQRYLDGSPQGEHRALVQRCIQQRRSPAVLDRRDPDTVQRARQLFDEATALYRRQQFRQAAERFLEGSRQFSDITEFLYNAAAAYRAGRRWPDAVRTYRQYLETPGAEPDAYIELAQCHHEQGRYTDAVAAYRRYIQLEPQGTFAADARQYVQTMTSGSGESGGTPPSREDVRQAGEAFNRGMAHYQAGRWEQAAREFRAAEDLVPTRETLYNIGICYQELGQWARALTNFENFLRGGDTGADAEGHLSAALCQIELNQPAPAEQHIRRYLQRANAADLPGEDADRRWAAGLQQRIRRGSGASGGSSRIRRPDTQRTDAALGNTPTGGPHPTACTKTNGLFSKSEKEV